MTSSWEDASRCPADQSPGKEQGKRPFNGGQLITLTCQNTRCEYNDTGWVVQIRPDGTIPEPTTERDKFFPKLAGWQKERARDRIQNLEDQLKHEMLPGGEIRR